MFRQIFMLWRLSPLSAAILGMKVLTRGIAMTPSIKSLGLFLLGLLGLHLGPVSAQTSEAGVLCSEIEGESERPDSTGCIDVLAWSWGQSAPVSLVGGGGGPTVGVASIDDFTFTKTIDSSSEDFFRMLVTGTPFKGIVEYRQYGDCGTACQAPEPYLTINFRDVFVTSNSSSGSSGGSPNESVSLAFVEVSYCYRPTIKDSTLGSPQCFAFSRATNAQIPPF
jgi:type VI protein secretion system component Hcp